MRGLRLREGESLAQGDSELRGEPWAGEKDQSWHRASSLCPALGPHRFLGGCYDLVPYPPGDTLPPARASRPLQGLPASLPQEGPVLMVPSLLSPKPQLPPTCFPPTSSWPAFGRGSTLVPTPGGACLAGSAAQDCLPGALPSFLGPLKKGVNPC